ncbi:MAG: type III-A CRISPR-associated RAMP protein Csm4 [Candidatus Odinarchaeota archaeon]|nr:type III-A CRISPR-associated RAMP protein Csm4 [Candidatus Odinarchaeota archaeon]
MNVEAVQLKFTSALRVGKRGLGEESTELYIPSDTIFSAFINTYAKLFGIDEATALVNLYIDRNPPFIISSAFPYFSKNGFVLYAFVKPILPLKKYVNDVRAFKNLKKIKKAILLSKMLFEEIINGRLSLGDLLEKVSSGDIIMYENILMTVDEFQNIEQQDMPIKIKIDSHNTLDRYGCGSLIYFTGSVSFSKESGLYFLVKFYDNSFKKKFYSTLNLLSDDGIGGNRSIGHGIFRYTTVSLDLKVPENSKYVVTLSRYIPTRDEIKKLCQSLDHPLFELVRIGGFVQSPYTKLGIRRPTINMISEGSLLPFSKDIDLLGKTVELANIGIHKVVRYGYAFLVGISYGTENN